VILTHPQVSKQQIPDDVLDEWKCHPVSAEKGPGGDDQNAEGDQPAQGSGKIRPKPKKGLSYVVTPPTFADH
jgi:hypothetical protein